MTTRTLASTDFTTQGILIPNVGADMEYQLVAANGYTGVSVAVEIAGGQTS
jgi:hypothetical protein